MLPTRDRELTPTQRGMVFHDLVDSRSGVNIEQIVVTLDPSFDAGHFEAAWRAVIDRHPALHSRLVESAPGEYRLATVSGFAPELVEVDATASAFDSAAAEWLADDRARGFDIFAQVPLRLALLRNPHGGRFIWTYHHVLLDSRSSTYVLVDIWDAYHALQAGETPQVPSRPDDTAFVDQLREFDPVRSIGYWRNLLAGIDRATPFPVTREPITAHWRRAERVLDAGTSETVAAWVRTSCVTFSSLIQAAWATLLSRHTDHGTVVFGATRDGRGGNAAAVDPMLGMFASTVPVLAAVERSAGIELVRALHEQQAAGQSHEHVPLAQMRGAAHRDPDEGLFQTVVAVEEEDLDTRMHRLRPGRGGWHFARHEQPSYPIALTAWEHPRVRLRLAYQDSVLTPVQAERLADHVLAILRGIVAEPTREARRLPLLNDDELQLIERWNATACEVEPATIQAAFARAVALHPHQAALTGAGRTLSYAELDSASDIVATALASHGVVRGVVVGVGIERSLELVIAMLGVLKAGAAYLPLDPAYPDDRLAFCLHDSGVERVLTQQRHAHRFQAAGVVALEVEALLSEAPTNASMAHRRRAGSAEDLAYLIYTSGSTGKPKAVLVTHANVVNFFAGMDAVVERDGSAQKRWLAVTSVSFDISVVELLWTLTRGFETVVHGARELSIQDTEGPSFSLFHFASGADASDPQPYRLIVEAAKFADAHGLEAVWSPERHFHDFGAPYPNPALMGAALSTITTRVQIRAGSVVLPLHDPLRVVEDWSLVDQLSNGRVGVSFASGWQPNDFVLAPANYQRRKELMFEQIETVRTLWRGDRIKAMNPKGDEVLIGTYPRPIQKELPIWITAAGSPDTFRQAGAAGANVLTHMLGQTLADLEANIGTYRQARAAAGHDLSTGRVTVMVHTFIGDDDGQVREIVREPMQRYLRSAASLVGAYANTWAAFKRGAGETIDAAAINELSSEQQRDLYDFAFERYFESSGLLGSVEKCARLVESLGQLGVDEVACLIDFGVAPEMAIAHLPYLCRLRDFVRAKSDDGRDNLVREIARHAITHLQCTPSLASTIPMLARTPEDLASLRQVLIGGEALPPDLVATLHERLPNTASIVNMYGPTETTVWSTTQPLKRGDQQIGIGRPIANTSCYVLDSLKQLVPPGCVGELHIGGAGVTLGYHDRPEPTAERFFDLLVGAQEQRVYATGDLVRQQEDGCLQFLGRNDFQVKVRGHRIELGEIEVALRAEPGVADAVVVARTAPPGPQMLIGYLVAAPHGSTIGVDALRQSLLRRLPEYMVPNTFVWLETLPLTPNGKLDRQALPLLVSPEQVAPAAGIPAQRSEAEQVISQIWRRVLNIPEIGLRDNFFELGGHSILAIKVQSELSLAFGYRLPIVELFRSPTIEALAAHFAQRDASTVVTSIDAGVGKANKRKVAMNLRVAMTGRPHDAQ